MAAHHDPCRHRLNHVFSRLQHDRLMAGRILQPHELAARGLTVVKPGPATQNEVQLMPITSNSFNREQGEMYTAQEDVTRTLEDGRIIQVVGKGGQIPLSEAIKLGIIKPEQKA